MTPPKISFEQFFPPRQVRRHQQQGTRLPTPPTLQALLRRLLGGVLVCSSVPVGTNKGLCRLREVYVLAVGTPTATLAVIRPC